MDCEETASVTAKKNDGGSVEICYVDGRMSDDEVQAASFSMLTL